MLKTSIKLFKGKTLKNGEHPFVLQLSLNRKTRRISLGYSCKDSIWNSKPGSFRYKNPEVRKNKKYYQDLESKLNDKLYECRQFIIDFEKHKEVYSLDEITEALRNKDTRHDFYLFMQRHIESLRAQGKVGNAKVYKNALKAVQRYHTEEELLFESIDFKFLNKLQEFWSLSANENTISQYMRTIRAIFNRAINEGLISADLYPFKKYEISKLDTSTTPRPLSEDELKALLKVELEPGSKEEFARDLFFFSFHNRGMNFADIAYLTWDDIYGDRIHYNRKKIRSTSKRSVYINIGIIEPVAEILGKYSKSKGPGVFVFPIFKKEIHKTENQKFNRRKKVLKQVNDALKTLAGLAEINRDFTFYFARHSWANLMQDKNVPIKDIQEGLAHSDLNVTLTYLDKFSNDRLDEMDDLTIL
jgi:integrase